MRVETFSTSPNFLDITSPKICALREMKAPQDFRNLLFFDIPVFPLLFLTSAIGKEHDGLEAEVPWFQLDRAFQDRFLGTFWGPDSRCFPTFPLFLQQGNCQPKASRQKLNLFYKVVKPRQSSPPFLIKGIFLKCCSKISALCSVVFPSWFSPSGFLDEDDPNY